MTKEDARNTLAYYSTQRDMEDCDAEVLEKAFGYFPNSGRAYKDYIYAKSAMKLIINKELYDLDDLTT